ncbi:aldo/keto reductase [Brevundimonas vesicularis]|uniref:Aldo/keto reductase n=1 Tax=Brevundimonas vesicularis TaxID=41276 RepID=A0A1Z3U7X3_BREVE|nr:aldo/keto reductase [Brevundimonas vesicularis]ASE39074.1 aldo/keto reductase [Brevundimonas vesicularis]
MSGVSYSPATPSASSPIHRLALAVVTEPERAPGAFMSAPSGAREDAMRFLLQTGADAGVKLIATRPEGDGERLLGQAWPFPSPFQVTVRTVALSEGLDRVEARARRSLERMGLPRGDVLLISNAADLAGAEGRALWDRARSLKDRGLFRRIGFCATIEDGPALLARRLEADVVQVPCSLLDQRAAQDGVLEAIADTGASVHLSSVFAGGLLFAGGDDLPAELASHAQALSRTRRRLAEQRCDPMQAALGYALALPGVDKVVASVASAAELRAILAAAHAPCPNLDWAALALEAPAAFTADARARISSAA